MVNRRRASASHPGRGRHSRQHHQRKASAWQSWWPWRVAVPQPLQQEAGVLTCPGCALPTTKTHASQAHACAHTSTQSQGHDAGKLKPYAICTHRHFGKGRKIPDEEDVSAHSWSPPQEGALPLSRAAPLPELRARCTRVYDRVLQSL